MPRRFPDGLPSVVPQTVTRLERHLPTPGDIKVQLGARVEPDDLIGQCSIPGDPILLDVAGVLGTQPRDVVRRLRRKQGERIGLRDLLARRRGRSILAPASGTVTAIDEVTGFVVLTPDPMPASVSAALRGRVVDIQPNRSVTIETPAAVVQGAVGFGGEQWGVLRLLATDPGDIITPEMIDARSAFTIVIGGASITADALRKAQKEQVKGVVVGSIDARQLQDFWGEHFANNWLQLLQMGAPVPRADDSPTIFITEGFGVHPMSRPIFDLLTQFDRQEAHLDGTTRLDVSQRRPRLIIPLAGMGGNSPAPPTPPVLRPGATVRLLDEAHLGRIGRVERLNPHGRLASGVRTATAAVQIGDAEHVVVPERALEVLG